MIALPGLHKNVNLLSPLKEKEILKRMSLKTAPPSRANAKLTDSILFNGIIGEHGFVVSSNAAYPQYFIPFVSANLIEGDSETLLKIELRLFRGAKIFVVLWTAICTIAVIFSIYLSKPFWAVMALAITLLNYLIARENFRMHCRKCVEVLKNLLDID